MRNLTILLLIFSLSNTIAVTSIIGTNIKSYDIKIKLDTTLRKIEAKTAIEIENVDINRSTNLFLSRIITIDSATINGMRLKFSRIGDTLQLQIKAFKRCNLCFYYCIPADSFLLGKSIVLTRGMKWCPYMHDNISLLNSEVTVPKGYNVYSSGASVSMNRTGNNWIFKYSNKINSGLPFIIAPTGYYSETIRRQNGITIKYCFLIKDTLLQKSIINESLSAIKFCTNYVGNYKRKQLTYIEVPDFGSAQSIETFILMSSEFIKFFSLYKDMRFWVTHETIHQWIGVGYFNSIHTSPKYGTFIEESLTEYIRYIYIEKTFGKDSLSGQIKYVMNIYNKEIKGTDQDVPVSVNLPNRVVYCVGPLIFHVVRMDTGEEKWHGFIRKMFSRFYGRNAGYDDFVKTLRSYATKDVINKMEENINKKGIPDKIGYN